jgi:WD40 repeat protein
VLTLTGPLRRLDAVAFSPDGAEVAAVGGFDSAFGIGQPPDRGVMLWRRDGDPSAPRHLFPDRTAADIGYSADGRWLLVTLVSRAPDSEAPLGLFAVDRRHGVEPAKPLGYHQSLAAAGDRLLSSGWASDSLDSRTAVRLTAVGGRPPFQPVWERELPAGTVPYSVALLSGGRAAVLERIHSPRHTDRFELVVCDAGGLEAARVPLPGLTPGRLTPSPDGTQLVVNTGGSLFVWAVADLGAGPRKVTFGKKHCTGVAFHTADGYLLAAGNDGAVRKLDAASWKPVGGYTWKAGKARSVAVAPDGLTAAVGTSTGRVIVFDLG